MCWISLKDQTPWEGLLVDVWVVLDGVGFRKTNIQYSGGAYHHYDVGRQRRIIELPERSQAGITHFKPVPGSPE